MLYPDGFEEAHFVTQDGIKIEYRRGIFKENGRKYTKYKIEIGPKIFLAEHSGEEKVIVTEIPASDGYIPPKLRDEVAGIIKSNLEEFLKKIFNLPITFS